MMKLPVILLVVSLVAVNAIHSRQYDYKPSSYPASSYHDTYDYAPAYYTFDYGVKDEYAYLDFGHNEDRSGDRTSGQYHVVLPDGRKEVVNYYVDGYSGFVADVDYQGEARYAQDYKPTSYAKPTYKPVKYSEQVTYQAEPAYKPAADYGSKPAYRRPSASYSTTEKPIEYPTTTKYPEYQTTYKPAYQTTKKPRTYQTTYKTTTYEPTTYKPYVETTYKPATTYKPRVTYRTTTYKPVEYTTTTYKPVEYTTTYKPTTYRTRTSYEPAYEPSYAKAASKGPSYDEAYRKPVEKVSYSDDKTAYVERPKPATAPYRPTYQTKVKPAYTPSYVPKPKTEVAVKEDDEKETVVVHLTEHEVTDVAHHEPRKTKPVEKEVAVVEEEENVPTFKPLFREEAVKKRG